MNLLSKPEFCETMNSLKKSVEFADKLNRLFRKYDIDTSVYSTALAGDLIKVLKVMFRDEEDWISYWCWERDFGKRYELGDVKYADGTAIPLGTAEELYDFLIENMKTQKGESTNV